MPVEIKELVIRAVTDSGEGMPPEVLARAMENFDRRQESAKDPRPTQDRPQKAGVLTGVRAMLSKLTDRPALAATASVAALCVALVVFQPGLLDRPFPVEEG